MDVRWVNAFVVSGAIALVGICAPNRGACLVGAERLGADVAALETEAARRPNDTELQVRLASAGDTRPLFAAAVASGVFLRSVMPVRITL